MKKLLSSPFIGRRADAVSAADLRALLFVLLAGKFAGVVFAAEGLSISRVMPTTRPVITFTMGGTWAIDRVLWIRANADPILAWMQLQAWALNLSEVQTCFSITRASSQHLLIGLFVDEIYGHAYEQATQYADAVGADGIIIDVSADGEIRSVFSSSCDRSAIEYFPGGVIAGIDADPAAVLEALQAAMVEAS